MKKIVCLLICFVLLALSAGCIGGAKEYTDDEIYDAFLVAEDFYNNWIYMQSNADMTTTEMLSSPEIGSLLRSKVNHDTIKTTKQLTKTINSLFVKSKADEYISFLDAEDADDGLYVNHYPGFEGRFITYKSHTVEKLEDGTYLLTLKFEHMADGRTITSQVVCTPSKKNLLFDNYEDSPYADDKDYWTFF